MEWKPMYEYDDDVSGRTVLLYCEKYGICEARYQVGHGTWYIFKVSECVRDDDLLYCEMPEPPI